MANDWHTLEALNTASCCCFNNFIFREFEYVFSQYVPVRGFSHITKLPSKHTTSHIPVHTTSHTYAHAFVYDRKLAATTVLTLAAKLALTQTWTAKLTDPLTFVGMSLSHFTLWLCAPNSEVAYVHNIHTYVWTTTIYTYICMYECVKFGYFRLIYY